MRPRRGMEEGRIAHAVGGLYLDILLDDVPLRAERHARAAASPTAAELPRIHDASSLTMISRPKDHDRCHSWKDLVAARVIASLSPRCPPVAHPVRTRSVASCSAARSRKALIFGNMWTRLAATSCTGSGGGS